MDEELSKILENEKLDSNAKAEAIKKIVGDKYVPTEKYSDDVVSVKNENKQLKESIKVKDTEIAGYKDSRLTEEQRKQKESEDIVSMKKELAIEKSQIQAEKILSKVITDEKELEDLVRDIAKEDTEATKLLAQNIVNTINKQKEAAEARVKEELIKDTPKPNGGEQNQTMTKEEFNKLGYNEQVKYKTENPDGYKELMKN